MTRPIVTSHVDIGLLRRCAGEGYSDEHRINVNRYFHHEDGQLAVAIVYVDVTNAQWDVKTFGAAIGYGGGGCFEDASFIIWPSGRSKVWDNVDYTGVRLADVRMLDLIAELLGDYYEWDDGEPVFNHVAERLMHRVKGMSGKRLIDETFEATRLGRVDRSWSIGYHFPENEE